MIENNIVNLAVSLLKEGGVVAFPTETVYGLGADARNAIAIRRVFQIKNRPFHHPLIVHIATEAELSAWVDDLTPAVVALADAFWPGPLTMILKKHPSVLDEVTGGQDSVAVRVPSHPVAQQLLNAFGNGIVGPSANQFTHISPTTALAVQQELGNAVDLIVDGGVSEIGVESTIVSLLEQHQTTILRPGKITAQHIEAVTNMPCVIRKPKETILTVPGSAKIHYAPRTKTWMMGSSAMKKYLLDIAEQKQVKVSTCFETRKSDVAFALGTRDSMCDTSHLTIACLLRHMELPSVYAHWVHIERMPTSADAYAHCLYATLRALDHGAFEHILIEAVPRSWIAIWDRLSKASGGNIFI